MQHLRTFYRCGLLVLLFPAAAAAQLNPMQVYGEVSEGVAKADYATFLFANRDALLATTRNLESNLNDRWQVVKHLASPAQKEWFDSYDWLALLEIGAAHNCLVMAQGFLLDAQADAQAAQAAWEQSWDGQNWVQAQLQIAHEKGLSASTNALAANAHSNLAWERLSTANGYLLYVQDVVENVEELAN